jgi:hypothetical protein
VTISHGIGFSVVLEFEDEVRVVFEINGTLGKKTNQSVSSLYRYQINNFLPTSILGDSVPTFICCSEVTSFAR